MGKPYTRWVLHRKSERCSGDTRTKRQALILYTEAGSVLHAYSIHFRSAKALSWGAVCVILPVLLAFSVTAYQQLASSCKFSLRWPARVAKSHCQLLKVVAAMGLSLSIAVGIGIGVAVGVPVLKLLKKLGKCALALIILRIINKELVPCLSLPLCENYSQLYPLLMRLMYVSGVAPRVVSTKFACASRVVNTSHRCHWSKIMQNGCMTEFASFCTRDLPVFLFTTLVSSISSILLTFGHEQIRGFDELGGSDDFHEDTMAFVLR